MWEHRVKPTGTKGQSHDQPIEEIEGVIFSVAVALEDEPTVLHKGGGELHAQAAEEEEVAGRVTETDGPGNQGEAVVDEHRDVLLFRV